MKLFFGENWTYRTGKRVKRLKIGFRWGGMVALSVKNGVGKAAYAVLIVIVN